MMKLSAAIHTAMRKQEQSKGYKVSPSQPVIKPHQPADKFPTHGTPEPVVYLPSLGRACTPVCCIVRFLLSFLNN